MGWASYLEDQIRRLEDSIHMAQAAFAEASVPNNHQHQAGLAALVDARALIGQAWQHLDLATSPELDKAHELLDAQCTIRNLEGEVKAKEQARQQIEQAAAELHGELVDARREISNLKKALSKSNKLTEKLMRENFAAALDLYSSEPRIKKGKPDPD